MKGGEFTLKTLHIGTICVLVFLFSFLFTSPSFANTSESIQDNGSHSDSTIEIQEDHEMNIVQSNETEISNEVSVNNNTGGNTVSGTARGNVTVETGDADATVAIENVAGANTLNMSHPGGSQHNFKISDNGYGSDNEIQFESDHEMNIFQSNEAEISNDVSVTNNTGNNSVRGTTRGDVSIETGDADATITISNTAGANILKMIGKHSNTVNAALSDNGAKSDNRIEFDMNHRMNLGQHNDTEVNNSVDVHNNTGSNSVRGDHQNSGNNYDCDQHNTYRNCDDHDYDRDDQKNCDSYKPMKHEKDCDCDKKQATLSWYKRNNNWMKYPRNNHNSGNNSSGNVSIRTGNANATITLTNTAGLNWLSI